MKIFWAFLIAIFIVGFAFPAFGQDNAVPITLKIGQIENNHPGVPILIPIKITAPEIGVETIDLRIGYNADALKLIDVIPSAFLQSRGMKSFAYHLWPENIDEPGYPSGLVRITAELDRSAIDSNFIPDPLAAQFIAYLSFEYASDTGDAYNPQAINFFWTGCGDNVIYSTTGDTIFISKNVFDTIKVNITNDTLLPTGAGAPTICLTGLPRDYDKTVMRGIDFWNGGISIDSMRVKIRPFDFKIGISEQALQGDQISIPIIKAAGSWPMGNFDFTIAYDTSALEFMGVVQGEAFDIPGEYEWEYFTYRWSINNNDPDPAASGLIRVVGISNQNDGAHHPIQLKLPDNFPLFNLRFRVLTNPVWKGTFIPVQFYWLDCIYNTVTFFKNPDSLSEVNYAISDTVYGHAGNIINQLADFPTFYGANNSCLAVSPGRPVLERFINFTNGGVDVINDEPINAIGDINLNTIPYEYADVLLFAEYFVQGPLVFTINERAQTAASDINQDGAPLMIDDFQYMTRMIYDGHLPAPGLNFSGTVTAIPEYDKLKIVTNLEKPGGAMLLTFLAPDSGVVVTVGADVAWDMRYHFSGDTMKVLVFDLAGDSIGSGPREILKLYYGGPPPELIDAIATGFSGEGINLQIKGQVPFSIKIDSVIDIWPGQHALVPVVKIGGQENIWGFDFLFAFDTDALIFAGITPGDAFAVPGDYEWEYFTYRNNLTPCSGCPGGMLRVVGMADQNDGAHHPLQKVLPDNFTLFTLDFLASDNPIYKCQVLPIRFIWTDCGDNAIAFGRDIDPTSEIKLAISNHVYEWGGNEITGDLAFPSLTGANSTCILNPPGQRSAERFIDFFNGYVEMICADSIYYWGDLNLNGVVPEIADIILFSDYFLKGLSVFTIFPADQIVNSDLNQDGIPLMIDDFQYLTRMLSSGSEPAPGPSFSGTISTARNDNVIKVTSDLEEPGGAILLTFYAPDSSAIPILRLDTASMFMRYHYSYDTLKVIIFSLTGKAIGSGPQEILDIGFSAQEPKLVDAIAAGYNAEPIYLSIQDGDPYSIEIGKLDDISLGSHAYVPITKTAGVEDMWGFDFLIAYDASALTFTGAIAGEIFDMSGIYRWEYFTYRFGADGDCGNACPSGMLRVVGIADQNDGARQPLSKDIPNGMTLFMLDFFVSSDRTLECQNVPIRFFWMDCGDNTIAFSRVVDPYPYNIETAISDGVFDFLGAPIEAEAEFPTYLGANSTCLPNQPGKSSAERYIDFYNGYINIVCAETLDTRGDINLNGISCEIGDAVIFYSYFLNGLSAFTIDINRQIAASDVNADGIPLSVADFQFLVRTVVGESSHMSNITYDADYGIIDKYDGQLTVAVHSDSAIGCLYFVFNVPDTLISIVPRPEISSMEFRYTLGGGLLRILIYSFELNSIMANDTMPLFDLNYSGGKPESGSIEGATLEGEKIRFNRILNSPSGNNDLSPSELPKSFSLDQNWPNPFNLSTEIQFALPSKTEWTMEIFNIQGQKIRTFSGFDPAGQINIFWDGTDKSGSVQPSGIYLYRLRAGQYTNTKKMILIK
jgi:hypothetical protein